MPKKKTTKKSTKKTTSIKRVVKNKAVTKTVKKGKKTGRTNPIKFTPFKFVHMTPPPNTRLPELCQFIIWSSLPKAERKPQTQIEFAKQLRVNKDTLTRWGALAGFHDEVFIYTTQYIRRWTPRIAQGLALKASTGSAKEVELYFKIFEKFTETVILKEDPTTPETIKAMEDRMNNWDKKRKAKAMREIEKLRNEDKVEEEEIII